MPDFPAALKPLTADALKPRPKAEKENASLHPASLHSLTQRPAPLAKAHSEKQVVLTPAPSAPDPLPLQPPAFASKSDPEPQQEDWAAFFTDDVPEEDSADEPEEDFALNLPEPAPVSLFEELPAPKKSRWPQVLLWSAVLAAIAAGVYFSWRMIG